MILQLALPHENVSWIATKVVDNEIAVNSVMPPTGGIPIDFKELINKLRDVFKNNTKSGAEDLKAFLL